MVKNNTARRIDADRRGRRAETIAAWWLRCKGYSILGRRVRTSVGEIDLVAARAGTLIFVEVKARETRDAAMLALTAASMQRVANCAKLLTSRYSHKTASRPKFIRIDAVLVVPGRWPHHIEAVWQERR
jgi:putative endonuclease